MTTHVMLDLETLSTRKDAAIIQIAAVAFDPQTGVISDRFNQYVRDPSGRIDVDTVAWWLQQRGALHMGTSLQSESAIPEDIMLRGFAGWFDGIDAEALWSHGATFDIVVLENTYTRDERTKPWSHKIERDTRTLYALAPGGTPTVAVDPARKHDALYDCEVQVLQVVGALAAIKYCVATARDLTDPAERHRVLPAHLGGDLPGAPMLETYCTADTERAPAPSAALAYDPPPVWSRAEGFTEALANPRSDVDAE